MGCGEPSVRADVVMSMSTDDFVKMFSGKFPVLLVYLLFRESLILTFILFLTK